jgi:dipeptidyl aminopeptidase/acylaminoacyl peptidase
MRKKRDSSWPGTSWAATLTLCLSVALPAAAAETPDSFPSNETMRHLRSLNDPQLSPDGTRALLRVDDAAADGGKSHLWLIDVGGKKPRQLTFSPNTDKRGERSGQWAPDGQSILFLAHRGEQTGLYALPMDGGEAKALDIKVRPMVDASKEKDALPPAKPGEVPEPVEDLPVDIESYRQSPDGAWIAFIARDPETPGEKKQKDAKADAQWVDNDPHGARLYLFRRDTSKVTPVPIVNDVREFAWRDDSTALIALVEAPHSAGDLGFARTSWVLEIADPEHPRQLAALPASIDRVVWSADGHSAVYSAQARRDTPPGYNDLYVSELAGQKTRDLTDGLEGSVESEEPVTLPDGRVVQLIDRGVDVAVAVYPPDSVTPKFLQLPTAAVSSVRSNARHNGWLFLGSSGGKAPGLYYAADLTGAVKQLDTPSVAPDHTRTVAPKRVRWTHEGLRIDGLLYLPPEAASRAVPLIVEVHGGPAGLYADRFAPYADFLVGHGWAVLRTNPRGSIGRGAAFVAANKNDLGGADYRDIMAGVDYVLKTEHLDPTRMALMGYSYGGEMAAFVEGRTNRFKAIVSGAPVIDQYSEYGTEGESWYDRWYFGKPWERSADAWRQSPLARVGAARTPFLLLQGEVDSTDPLGQAQEMYRALRQTGVPVDLVTYPRDNHGPLASALYGAPVLEPWHGFDARRRVVAFIEKAFGP